MNRPTRLLVLVGCVGALLTPAVAAAAATPSTTVVRAAATTTVATPTTLAATVTPTTSAGTVRFLVAGTVAPGCGAVKVRNGRAVCTVTFTSSAATRVTARYTGGGGLAASTGARTVTPAEGRPGQLLGGVGGCTTTAGALVAVSYGAWGGPIVRGCDTTPTTGIELLTTARFTTTGTRHDGPQFLCRIGHPFWKAGAQYPTAATEACVNTPPADAYWSYWIAPRGQNTWSYSPFGAYADRPTHGEVEAWTFGATDIGGTTGQPTFTPNQIRAGLPTA